MSFTPPSSYTDSSQGTSQWSIYTLDYQTNHASNTTTRFYYDWSWMLYPGQYPGYELYFDSSNNTWNDGGNNDPASISVNNGTPSTSVVVQNGDTITCFDASNPVPLFSFVMSGISSSGGNINPLSQPSGGYGYSEPETPRGRRARSNFW